MIKKVLVTGADGFIGSHLVENLVSSGISVRAFCYYNSLNSIGWLSDLPKKILDSVEIIHGDIRDFDRVDSAVNGCNAVIHLAALIAIPYSYSAPRSYIETNVIGTLNILQSSLKNNIERFIQTSTSEVYGTAQYVPIDEKHPLKGQSPYSASKIASDQIAYSFFSSFNLPVVTLRPFNTYGPRQSNRAVIPTIISQALKNNIIKIGNTDPTRDFNFIKDTVASFKAVLLSNKGAGDLFNIGSNFEVSIADTVKLIANLMGTDIELQHEERRIRPEKSEVERLFASNKKFIDQFNYIPLYSGVDGFTKGLQETIKWFSDPVNLSKYNTDEYVI
jgi:NAD dependent epimerase/dehydratase